MLRRFFLLSIALLVLSSCKSLKLNKDFFGLTLGEKYLPAQAADILKQTTNIDFYVDNTDESCLYMLVGKNVYFADVKWHKAYFYFEEDNSLGRVCFESCYNNKSDIERNWAKGEYNRVLHQLKYKYGEPTEWLQENTLQYEEDDGLIMLSLREYVVFDDDYINFDDVISVKLFYQDLS